MKILSRVRPQHLWIIVLITYFLTLFVTIMTTKTKSIDNVGFTAPSVSFSYLWCHNVGIAIMVLASSFFTLGIVPLVHTFISAGVLGCHIGAVTNHLQYLLLVLPHGIIEIPATLFLEVTGLRFTVDIISNKFRWKRFAISVLIIILSFTLAAILEAFITPGFTKYV